MRRENKQTSKVLEHFSSAKTFFFNATILHGTIPLHYSLPRPLATSIALKKGKKLFASYKIVSLALINGKCMFYSFIVYHTT